MNWEYIIKNDFKEFIKEMKTVNLMAQKKYTDYFSDKTESHESVEMINLANSIIDMGKAIKELENMRKKQEKLR